MSDEEQVFERGAPIHVVFVDVPKAPDGPLNIGECGWYNSKKPASLSTARIRRKNPLETRNRHRKGDWK